MKMRYLAKSLLFVMAWSIAGCDRAPETATPVANSEIPAPSAQNEADATESSLELKRGRLSLSEERVLFQPCGAQDEWWVIDQTPTMLTHTFIEESQGASAEIYIEAYGERAPASGDASAQGAKFILMLEEILYAGVPGEVRGCDAPAPSYVVAARGTEPFWSVEVHEQRMVWRQPDEPKELVFGAPDTLNAEGGVRYAGVQGAHQLELIVHAQACRDAMSGEYFAYTAKASLDGKDLTGCARLGE
jgi:uncharacterized membrane protein